MEIPLSDIGFYSLLTLIALFYLGFIIAMYFLVRSFIICTSERTFVSCDFQTWSITKVIKFLLPFPILARALDMTIGIPHYMTQSIKTQDALSMFLGGAPGYIFFTTYALLVVFWLVSFHRAHDKSPKFIKKVKLGYFVVNIVVYFIWASLVVAFIFFENQHTRLIIHFSEAVFASVISIAASLSFLYYGIRVYRKLTHFPVVSEARKSIANKIGVLTSLLSIVFTARCILVLLDMFFFSSEIESIISKIVYQIMFELVPGRNTQVSFLLHQAILILYVLGKRVPGKYDEYVVQNKSGQNQSNENSPLRININVYVE